MNIPAEQYTVTLTVYYRKADEDDFLAGEVSIYRFTKEIGPGENDHDLVRKWKEQGYIYLTSGFIPWHSVIHISRSVE